MNRFDEVVASTWLAGVLIVFCIYAAFVVVVEGCRALAYALSRRAHD